MMSLRTCAMLACLAPLPVTAAIAPSIQTDVYRELLKYRVDGPHDDRVTFSDAALGTPALLRMLLVDARSPYSELVAMPDMLNELWWEDFSSRIAPGQPPGSVLEALQWQLGLTKARPGREVDVSRVDAAAFRGVEAAAGAIKAGIPYDVFMKAWDMNPSGVTLAAHDAVALQLLREQMARTPRSMWPALGIESSVLDRYMAARSGDDISHDDAEYLVGIVTMALRSRDPGTGTDGKPRLPAAYRIARTAAAYKDIRGYFRGSPLCVNHDPNDDLPRDASAYDDNSPLCFVGATDRAVLAWYRSEWRLERQRIPIHENAHPTWHRAMLIFGLAMPLMDIAALVEFSEASVAGDMAETSGLEDAEAEAADARASSLSCGVRSA
ncbi:hypothetical protein KPL74_15550 [Bacillus sp. NP157]|nr:hypothetical protein KPL74_15550 [Bacillus sp. NP157]